MTMKVCYTKVAMPGMRLAMPVVNDNGNVLLMENTILTPVHIERLLQMGVQHIRVQVDFNDMYADTLGVIHDKFSNMRYFKEVPLLDMMQLVDCSIEPMIESPGIINNLLHVRAQDDYTFRHRSMSRLLPASSDGGWGLTHKL